jgi:hypothetical protein
LYKYWQPDIVSCKMELQVPVPFLMPRISEMTNIDTEMTFAVTESA